MCDILLSIILFLANNDLPKGPILYSKKEDSLAKTFVEDTALYHLYKEKGKEGSRDRVRSCFDTLISHLHYVEFEKKIDTLKQNLEKKYPQEEVACFTNFLKEEYGNKLKEFWHTKLYIKILGLDENKKETLTAIFPNSDKVFFSFDTFHLDACSLYFNHRKNPFGEKSSIKLKIRGREEEHTLYFYKGDTLIDTIRYFFLLRLKEEFPEINVISYFDNSPSIRRSKISPSDIFQTLSKYRKGLPEDFPIKYSSRNYIFDATCKEMRNGDTSEFNPQGNSTCFLPVFESLPSGENKKISITCCFLFTDGMEGKGVKNPEKDWQPESCQPGSKFFTDLRKKLYEKCLSNFHNGNFLLILPILFYAETLPGYDYKRCCHWSHHLHTPLIRYVDVITAEKLLEFSEEGKSFKVWKWNRDSLNASTIVQLSICYLYHLFGRFLSGIELKKNELWIGTFIPRDFITERKEGNVMVLQNSQDPLLNEKWIRLGSIEKTLLGKESSYTVGRISQYPIVVTTEKLFGIKKAWFSPKVYPGGIKDTTNLTLINWICVVSPCQRRSTNYLIEWCNEKGPKNYEALTSQTRIQLTDFIIVGLVKDKRGGKIKFSICIISSPYLWAPTPIQWVLIILFLFFPFKGFLSKIFSGKKKALSDISSNQPPLSWEFFPFAVLLMILEWSWVLIATTIIISVIIGLISSRTRKGENLKISMNTVMMVINTIILGFLLLFTISPLPVPSLLFSIPQFIQIIYAVLLSPFFVDLMKFIFSEVIR